MKYLMILAALCLGAPSFLTAQDSYLPVSTDSEVAKAAYVGSTLKLKPHQDCRGVEVLKRA